MAYLVVGKGTRMRLFLSPLFSEATFTRRDYNEEGKLQEIVVKTKETCTDAFDSTSSLENSL